MFHETDLPRLHSRRTGQRQEQGQGEGSTCEWQTRRKTKETRMRARCEGITAAGEQCKCWAVQQINEISYCKQHAQKELALAHGETVEDLLKELDWQVKELRERATGPAPEPAASGDAQELLELADWCVKAADGRCCSQCDTNWLHRAKTLRKVAAQAGATGGASLRSELIAELNSMVDSPTLPCPEFHISTPLGAALCKLLLATEARVLKAGASRNEVLEDK